MFQKSIEAIISSGVSDLEALSQQIQETADVAKRAVSRCQSEIQTLVNLGKQVPEKVFDRYSTVLVGTIEQPYEGTNVVTYAEVRVGDCHAQLHGLMGAQAIKRGKYRVIVLLEPIS